MAAPRVAIYARYSSAQQRDTSIEDQVRGCQEYASKQGWTVDPSLVFTDFAVSGASTARAGFDQLYALVRGKGVEVIIVENTDRLSRDLGDADKFFKQLMFVGVRLICFQDGIDSARKGSRQQFTMKAVVADWFLDDLRDKTLRGLKGQATRGFHTGGSLYGYKTEPVGDIKKPDGFRVVIDESQSLVVRSIFSEYSEGHSLDAIAVRLNGAGIKAPRLGYWRKSTISEMLRNPSYVGSWTYGSKEWRKDPSTGKRRYRVREASEIQRFDRPELRIVEQATWDAVQARTTATKKVRGKVTGSVRGTRRPRLLSGLLACASCGSPFTSNGGGYYRCGLAHAGGGCRERPNVREDAVLDAMVSELQGILTTSGMARLVEARVAARLAQLQAQSPDQGRELEARLAKLCVEIDRLITNLELMDPSTATPVVQRLKVKTAEKTKLESDLASLRAAESDQGPAIPTAAELMALMADIRGRLSDDPALGRQMLFTLLGGAPLIMSAGEDGSWAVRGEMFPFRILPKKQPQKSKVPGECSPGTPILTTSVARTGSGRSPSTSELAVVLEFRVSRPVDRRRDPSQWRRASS